MLASSHGTSGRSGFRSRFQSLKFSLLLVTGCIVSMLVAVLTRDGIDSWQRFKNAQALRIAETAGNRLVTGIYYLTREQPSVNTAFKTATSVSIDQRQRIDNHRKASDENLNASLPELLALDFPDKTSVAYKIRNARQQANEARNRIDTMIAVPDALRDQKSLKDYHLAISTLIDVINKLWSAEIYITSQNDPLLTRYARIKRLSWKLREIAGHERAVIATAIATGEHIQPASMRKIEDWRAQIQ